jgi:5-formyltetrahydrofolate cyclo-ligase
MTDLAAQKRAMRIEAAARRAAAHRTQASSAAQALCDHLLRTFDWPRGCGVAAYWPIGAEIDVRPLLERIAALGCVTALPVVVERGQPLLFRAWAPGDPLEPGTFDTRHPPASAREVVPDRLIVPLLAFDDEGYRLGYGAGYYDRTIASLREQSGRVTAIGVGYWCQRVPSVPHDEKDQVLDCIATERGVAVEFPRAGRHWNRDGRLASP